MATLKTEIFELCNKNLEDVNSFEKLAKYIAEHGHSTSPKIKMNISKIILWGTEEVARRIIPVLIENDIEIIDVIDSNESKVGQDFFGYKVKKPFVTDTPIVLAAYEIVRMFSEVEKKFPSNTYISAWDILLLFPNTSALPWNNLRHPGQLNLEYLESLLPIANQCENVSEFWMQVASRHFIGITNSDNYSSHARESEYFIKEINSTHNESVFLDLGAYNGDTISRFFNQKIEGKDNRIAIGVEADRGNYLKLLEIKDNYNWNIVAFNAAIGNKFEIAEFSEQPNSMGSSSLFFEPNSFIPSITIDSIYDKFEFTHVKFDIEGFERQALEGASKAITKSNAIWSIASYHLWDDFTVLPKYFSSEYSFFCSSHASRPWDTTFHFKKK